MHSYIPDDLLVSLNDSRAVIDSLLDSIPAMFANNSSMSNCMVSALLLHYPYLHVYHHLNCYYQPGSCSSSC